MKASPLLLVSLLVLLAGSVAMGIREFQRERGSQGLSSEEAEWERLRHFEVTRTILPSTDAEAEKAIRAELEGLIPRGFQQWREASVYDLPDSISPNRAHHFRVRVWGQTENLECSGVVRYGFADGGLGFTVSLAPPR